MLDIVVKFVDEECILYGLFYCFLYWNYSWFNDVILVLILFLRFRLVLVRWDGRFILRFLRILRRRWGFLVFGICFCLRVIIRSFWVLLILSMVWWLSGWVSLELFLRWLIVLFLILVIWRCWLSMVMMFKRFSGLSFWWMVLFVWFFLW